MIPVSEWNYSLDKWGPSILVLAIYVAIFPARVVVLLLLPADATYKWHPLHKVWQFWRFA